MSGGNKLAILALSLTVVAVSVTAFGIVLKNSAGEDLTKTIGIDQKIGDKVPLDAVFTNEKGEKIKFGSLLKDRPVVLTPVFYRCVDTNGTCLIQLEGLMKSLKAMKRDNIGESYDIVTLSIHPKETHELAAAKRADYLKQYGREKADQGWSFLVGDASETRKLLNAVGYRYKYNEKKDQVVHPAGIVILTPDGKVSKYFYGSEYPAKMLRDGILIAGRGDTGSTSTPILLGCFMYDETTGKTRLHVRNALKVTGFATLFILGTSIFMMSRKGRRTRDLDV